MRPKAKFPSVPFVPGALPGGLVRARFFDGMLLTQGDLETEQQYWRMKRQLGNRALGDGVVWGLRLSWDARRRLFTLSPGYALDCCGNDLVVECPFEIDERTLLAQSDPDSSAWGKSGGPLSLCPEPAAQSGNRRVGVVLQYLECPELPQPVHADPCASLVATCEPARIRETTRLLLSPPPTPAKPGPIDALCAVLDNDSGPSDPIPQPGQAPFELVTEFDDASDSCAQRPTLTGESTCTIQSQAISITLPTDVTEPVDMLRFRLRADIDWGHAGGRVLAADGSVVLDLNGNPIPSPPSWTLTVTDLASSRSGVVNFQYHLDQLEMVDSTGRRFEVGALVEGSLEWTLMSDDDGAAVLSGLARISTSEVTIQVVEPGEPSTCLDHLRSGLIFTGDAGCTVGLLILSALHILTSDLRNREETRDTVSVIYLYAWRLLGIDPDADGKTPTELADALDKLFADLCQALVYPGPRCRDAHHGVYLGCAELSDSGHIVSFDPWEFRRHVLTGPLLSHWAHQFGLASRDAIMARITQTICCVAGVARDVGLGGGSPAGFTTVAPAGYVQAPVGAATLYIGENPGEPTIDAALEAAGVLVSRRETVTWPALIVSVTEALTRMVEPAHNTNPVVQRATPHVLVSHPSSDLHLLVPAVEDAPRSAAAGASAINDILAPVLSTVGPLARPPIRDLVEGLVFATPVRELGVLGPDTFAVRDVCAALRAHRIASVGCLLDFTPEPLLASACEQSTNPDQEAIAAVIEVLFLEAETLLTTSAGAVARVAGPPETSPRFVRSRASDDIVVTAITATLAAANILPASLTQDAIRRVAERVASA